MNKTVHPVLVVEDEQVVRDLVGRVLTPPVFRLSLVSTVKQGLEWMERDPFDLLMTDLRLPDGHGVEVIQAFRKKFRSAPIVVITGSLTPEERLSEVDGCGIFRCLEKPFDVSVLREVVGEALGGNA